MNRDTFANLAALAAIQVSNALLPLLIFPYALVVVGTSAYAKLATTEALMIAALSVVLYSFEVDGVARVVNLDWRRDKDTLSNVFCTVLWARLLLFCGCLIAACFARLFLDRITADLLLAWLSVPLSYALQANWLFQAIERNVFIATTTVASRLSAASLIIVYIESPDHVLWIPIILGACYTLGALISLTYAQCAFGIKLQRISLSEIIGSLRYGWHVFISGLGVILYRDFNVVILGAAHGNANAIAVYSIAEKVTKGLQATMRPLSQFYLPKLLRRLKGSRQADHASLNKIAEYLYPQFMALTTVISIISLIYFFAIKDFQLDYTLTGGENLFLILAIMIPATYFGLANFMLGSAGLNHLNDRVYLYRWILIVGVVSIAICASLSAIFGATGAASSFVIAEMLLTTAILSRYNRNPSYKRDI